MIEWQKREIGECDKITDVPKGATIVAIDDVACYGVCEGCGKPILETDKYMTDREGIMLCEICMEAP